MKVQSRYSLYTSVVFLIVVITFVFSLDGSDYTYYIYRIKYGSEFDDESNRLKLGSGFYFFSKNEKLNKYLVLNKSMPDVHIYIDEARDIDLDALRKDRVIKVIASLDGCTFYSNSNGAGAIIASYEGAIALIEASRRSDLEWEMLCRLFN